METEGNRKTIVNWEGPGGFLIGWEVLLVIFDSAGELVKRGCGSV